MRGHLDEHVIASLLEQGFNYTEIARVLNISRQAVNDYCIARGLRSANVNRKRSYLAKKEEVVKDLLWAGFTIGAIAKRLDVPYGTLYNYMRKANIRRLFSSKIIDQHYDQIVELASKGWHWEEIARELDFHGNKKTFLWWYMQSDHIKPRRKTLMEVL